MNPMESKKATIGWKNSIIHYFIGTSIYNIRIYDLALSETLWLIEPGNFGLDIDANIGFVTSFCSFKTGANGKV
jgi:hypothetical protein